MKRLLLLLALVALVVAIPVSDVLAGGHKTVICHKGNTITVATAAVEKHVENHGDFECACGDVAPDATCVTDCLAVACDGLTGGDLATCEADETAACEDACLACPTLVQISLLSV